MTYFRIHNIKTFKNHKKVIYVFVFPSLILNVAVNISVRVTAISEEIKKQWSEGI